MEAESAKAAEGENARRSDEMNEPEVIGGGDPWNWAEFKIAILVSKCFDGS
jgi:hypothetical protein